MNIDTAAATMEDDGMDSAEPTPRAFASTDEDSVSPQSPERAQVKQTTVVTNETPNPLSTLKRRGSTASTASDNSSSFSMSLDQLVHPVNVPPTESRKRPASVMSEDSAADISSSMAALALFSLSKAPSVDGDDGLRRVSYSSTSSASTNLSETVPRMKVDQSVVLRDDRMTGVKQARLHNMKSVTSLSSGNDLRSKSYVARSSSARAPTQAVRRGLRHSPLRRSPRMKTSMSDCTDLSYMTSDRHDLSMKINGSEEPWVFFELSKQPKPKQRKSYRSENRYLSPNPFVIRYRRLTNVSGLHTSGAMAAQHVAVLAARMPQSGTASALLLDSDGRALPAAIQRELVGGDARPLVLTDTSAQVSFSLKMHTTSRGEQYRLAFDINWRGADGEERHERIISHPFRIDTNIRRQKPDND